MIKQKIIENPNQNNTHIIALTATAFNQDRNLMLELGCDDFIPKPFQEEILLDKIALYLGVEYIYEFEQDSDLK
jgi:two-component system CheB/CheR fusion protein